LIICGLPPHRDDSNLSSFSDNLFIEAFPAVFEDNFRLAIESLGIKLTVRNHAMGNNPCFAYDACIESHLGDDVDLLAWEQVIYLLHPYRTVYTTSASSYFINFFE
jgi:hypothetical protein